MPHKLSEPLSEEELHNLAQFAERFDDRAIRRLVATVRHWQHRAEVLQETLDGVVDIVLKEAGHEQTE